MSNCATMKIQVLMCGCSSQSQGQACFITGFPECRLGNWWVKSYPHLHHASSRQQSDVCFLLIFTVCLWLSLSGVTINDLLTLACLAIIQQPVSLVTVAVIAIEHAHTLMITTVVPKRTVVDHWGDESSKAISSRVNSRNMCGNASMFPLPHPIYLTEKDCSDLS